MGVGTWNATPLVPFIVAPGPDTVGGSTKVIVPSPGKGSPISNEIDVVPKVDALRLARTVTVRFAVVPLVVAGIVVFMKSIWFGAGPPAWGRCRYTCFGTTFWPKASEVRSHDQPLGSTTSTS